MGLQIITFCIWWHYNVLVHDVNTSEELITFENIKSNSDRMHFVEVKMAVEDAPVKLSNIAKAFASQNKSS